MTDVCVAGEPAETLFEALQRIKWKTERDGMRSGTVCLEPRLGDPFFRALMRVEAELMLEDANHLGQDDYEDRTHEQRGVDALVALALRVADAVEEARKRQQGTLDP